MRESLASILLSLCVLLFAVACQDTPRPLSTPAQDEQPANSQPPGSQTPVVPDQLRKFPKMKLSSLANYPVEGLRGNLQGRVLVELRIDRNGIPTGVKIIYAEADRVLQNAALRFIRDLRFDVSSSDFDVNDPTPFQATVKYCQPDCKQIAIFPNSNEITISARRVSRY